ncbi:transcription factor HES-4-A-like [Panonychus citri]|uniref:transcription factor HES-4-A-like n=1 Tax=Panonychus citri TaxID=50023 RepID=UPI002308213C|nr:transcription factor HES-4-A-like [Panonychus citri]
MKMSITRVDPLSIEIPKKPPNKSASEHRRATKPIMEKRRRARINNSLEQIKSLVLVGLNKDPTKHTKLEKADILEMTVEYLKDLVQIKSIDKLSAMKSFVAGIDECASEVKKFVNGSNDVDLAMKRRIVSSLKNNLSSLKLTNGLNHNSNLVSSTTSSSSSTGPSSPILSPLNMKTEPVSPLTVNRDALTTISFNYNNSTKSQSQLTPPPSANSSNESFRFSPVHFDHQSHHNLHNQYLNHHLNQSSNYIISPISPSSHLIDDPMDCIPLIVPNHLN